MANKTLNDKYEIPFLSEWIDKDGGKYTAFLIVHTFGSMKVPVVIYMKDLNEEEKKDWIEKGIANQFVRTIDEFKRNFKQIIKEEL